MEPVILPGDKLLVNKLAYKLRVPFTQKTIYEFDTPKRGDIIVFDYPGDPSINYVKRLIGLPGDNIKVLDGRIIVNNEDYKISISEDELERLKYKGGKYQYTEYGPNGSYIVQRTPHPPSFSEQMFTVPKDSFFVMGDNRDNSYDSRSWGFVPKTHLMGKAKWIYFSFDWPDGQWLPNRVRTERIGNALL